MVSNLELKEPICDQSVLRNVVVNTVRRLAVPNNLLVEISSSSSKLYSIIVHKRLANSVAF